jgi:hypothetical protein
LADFYLRGMAIEERIIFNDDDVIKGLTDQYNLVTKVNDAIRETEISYRDAWSIATKQLDESNKAMDKANDVTLKTINATNQAKRAQTGLRDGLKSVADQVNILGVNLGAAVDGLKQKAQAMKAVTGAIGGTNNMLKLFKVALISTGIGALVVLLGSMVAFLLKTEKGMNKVNVVLSALGAVVKVFIDRATKFGESLVKLFEGDVAGAFNAAKSAVSGLGDEIAKEVKNAVLLEQFLQRLKKKEEELETTRSKINLRLAEEKEIISDSTKSFEERVKANDRALEQLRILKKEELDVAAGKTRAASDALRDSREDEALKKKLREASNAQRELEAQFSAEERALNKSRNNLQAEHNQQLADAVEQRQQINAALHGEIDKFLDLLQKVRNEQLTPEQRIEEEFRVAKASVQAQFDLIKDVINLEKEKNEILVFLEQKKNREIQAERDKNLTNLESSLNKEVKALSTASRDVSGDIASIPANTEIAFSKSSDSIADTFDRIKVKLADALNVDNATLDNILNSIGSAVSQIYDAATAATQRAIEKNDELIESLREQEEEANDQLEKELERQEKGLANDVDGEKKRIESLQKEREKAEKESEKLRKKQLASQLVADAAAQASNIAVMITGLAKGTSILGPAGIPIFIAVLAGFFSLIAKAKAQSKKLYTGGPIDQEGVTGFVSISGRSDKGPGKGHTVSDSNLVLGGREFVVSEGPASKHREFLEALNRGEFDGSAGLNFALGHSKQVRHDQSLIEELRRKSNSISQAMILNSGFARLERAIKRQAIRTAYQPGDMIIEEVDGHKKYIQTEQDWRWKP